MVSEQRVRNISVPIRVYREPGLEGGMQPAAVTQAQPQPRRDMHDPRDQMSREQQSSNVTGANTYQSFANENQMLRGQRFGAVDQPPRWL